ncbi:MAG: ABC transporter permease [Bacteroidia bacterium]
MFDRDFWTEILDTLSANLLLTILTAFGVGWGVFMLTIMLGASNGLKNGVYQEFSGRATNSMTVWTRSTTMPYDGLPAGRSFEMTLSDYEAVLNEVDNLGVLCPRSQVGGYRGSALVTYGKNEGTFKGYGDYPNIREVALFDMTNGRFLNQHDLKENRKVVVIGKRIQEQLFEKDDDPVGKYINVQGMPFQVIGVFKTRVEGEDARDAEETMYFPFTIFKQSFNFGDRIGWLAMTAKPGVPVSKVGEQVKDIIRRRHRVNPEDDRSLGSWNMEEEFSDVSNLFLGITLLVWLVGTGTLLAGIIGVMNIMLIVVKERTKEFGVRRALGAKPWGIIGMVVTEALVITLAAGMIGMVMGVGVVELLNFVVNQSGGVDMFANPGVKMKVPLVAISILTFAGILAGLLPAFQAVSIKPVDALRSE